MYREIQHYRDALRTYITSTYHVSNPALVAMRAEILQRPGAIAQEPYIESTARYAGARRYRDLALAPAVSDQDLSRASLLLLVVMIEAPDLARAFSAWRTRQAVP